MTRADPIDSAGGPYFDDLSVGQVFDAAPAITLTSGVAAVHQAILGDRLRLPLDHTLARAVTGADAAPAHPGLVCDIAIGQSTLATRRVKANLFYRGLWFHRLPVLGDTLRTTTEVVGLKRNSVKPGRAPTGLAGLRVVTVDQDDRLVLDFHRCAMLPVRPGVDGPVGPQGANLDALGADTPVPVDPTAGWDAAAYRARVPGPHFDSSLAGSSYVTSADVVSSAPELARLTFNIAATHHDSRIGGQRLVYGGHTIGLALAQATRVLPNLVTVLGWDACDHIGPVFEGDTLAGSLHVEAAEPRPDGGGGVLRLRSTVVAVSNDGAPDRPVLDWRYRALLF
jgi:acyl dehydratase